MPGRDTREATGGRTVGRRRFGEPDWIASQLDLAVVVPADPDDRPEPELGGELEGGGDVVDHTGGDPRLCEFRRPFQCRPPDETPL